MADREPLLVRSLRFARALGVGGVATVIDFAVLTTQIRVFHIDPGIARFPALAAGRHHPIHRQPPLHLSRPPRSALAPGHPVLIFESVTLLMNGGFYQLLLRWLTPPLPPEVVSFIGTFIVFICFNYPDAQERDLQKPTRRITARGSAFTAVITSRQIAGA